MDHSAQGFPLPTQNPAQWVIYLTAQCNFACDYCIQKGQIIPGQTRKPWGKYDELSGEQWIRALNGMPVRPEHTLILTGGEPSRHKDFYEIAPALEGYKLDLTSNLTLDVDRLAKGMRAAGRTLHSSFHTYHPNFMEPERFVDQAFAILDSGVIDHPVISLVNLDEFPHFRGGMFDERVMEFIEIATRRNLPFQRNEFRGNHMGSPFKHVDKQVIDCTSAWVNVAPDGEIFNCQYHLEARKNSFGNITDIANVRTPPQFGAFFRCADFGFCDPCHENSGRGAFRDANGTVFRRDGHDPRLYLDWMEPAAISEVAQRYLAQGNLDEAVHAFDVALERLAASDSEGKADLYSDIGIRLWAVDQTEPALGAVLHAVEQGARDPKVIAAAVHLGHATDKSDHVRNHLVPFVPAETLASIEKAVAETIAD